MDNWRDKALAIPAEVCYNTGMAPPEGAHRAGLSP